MAALHPRLGSTSPVHSISPDLMEMIMEQRLGRPPRRALEKMVREAWAWRAFQLSYVDGAAVGLHDTSGSECHEPHKTGPKTFSRVEIAAVFGRGPVAAPPIAGAEGPSTAEFSHADQEEQIAAAVSHFPAGKQATLTAALANMGEMQQKTAYEITV